MESPEKDAQIRRLGLVLEVRYLDDSLIPNDPDDSIAVAFDQQQQQLQLQQPPEPLKAIPWGSPGTDTHAPFDHLVSPFQQPDHPQHQFSQQYSGEQYSDSPAVAGLPRSLQSLGPDLLQRIVLDPALLQSLLNPDGTVNELRVFQWQQSIVDKQKQFSSQRSQQSRFGPYVGSGMNADDRFGQPPSDYPMRGMQDRYGDDDRNNREGVGAPFPRRDQLHGSRVTRFGEKTDVPFFQEGPPGGGARDSIGNRRARNTRWGDVAASGGDTRTLQQPLAPQYPIDGFDDDRPYDQSYAPPRHRGREGGMFPDGDDSTNYGHTRGHRFGEDGPTLENRAGDWDNREQLPYGTNLDGGSYLPDGDGAGYGQPPQRKKGGTSKLNRFPSAKAAVPCRFFNTRKGCQFGDKCEFGHFSAGAVPNLPVPPQVCETDSDIFMYLGLTTKLILTQASGAVFSGMDSGPGSRPHHLKGPGMMQQQQQQQHPPTGFDTVDDEYAMRPIFGAGGVPSAGGMPPMGEGDFMQQKRVRR